MKEMVPEVMRGTAEAAAAEQLAYQSVMLYA